MNAQEATFDFLVEQAEWREKKAAEHPDDPRNLKSAFALRQLADFVLTLDPSDYRLKRLEILVCPSGIATPGEAANNVASRVGFLNGVVPPPSQSLRAFIDAALDDFRSDPTTIEPVEQLRFILDHEDSPEGLDAIGHLRVWLDSTEDQLVSRARIEGWPWQRIGDSLGQSKQAVWEKYRDADPRDTADT